ncbi:MAG: hypothetical protein JXA81_15300 [Sedimentisphaerales bacterium]|nr:hypothetical protein [Sedimentisphaerales bacterium]
MWWYHALAIAAIYTFGLWWCYVVIGRFRQDLREIFELKQVTRTAVIIFIWIITIPIMLGLVLYAYVLIRRFVWSLGTF